MFLLVFFVLQVAFGLPFYSKALALRSVQILHSFTYTHKIIGDIRKLHLSGYGTMCHFLASQVADIKQERQSIFRARKNTELAPIHSAEQLDHLSAHLKMSVWECTLLLASFDLLYQAQLVHHGLAVMPKTTSKSVDMFRLWPQIMLAEKIETDCAKNMLRMPRCAITLNAIIAEVASSEIKTSMDSKQDDDSDDDNVATDRRKQPSTESCMSDMSRLFKTCPPCVVL